MKDKNLRNFAENPFFIGHDNEIFLPDSNLGFIHKGGDFIGNNGFIYFNEAIKSLREPSGTKILNLGDSSTSGWNSDAISKEREESPSSPFFHYKTY
jgi:hypothetical protein